MSVGPAPSRGQIGPSPSDEGVSTNGSSSRTERAPWSFAWFAGVDLRVLEEVPSEQTFYRRLGWAVLLLSILSGVALSLALGYVLDGSAWRYAWAGLGWTVLLACGVEPLILQLSPTRRRFVMGIAVAWRVAFSMLLALQLSEPIILRINQPEIQQQLDTERRAAVEDARSQVKDSFADDINENLGQLKEIGERETFLKSKESDFLLRSEQSGKAQCGPICRHYRTRADQMKQLLGKAEEKNNERVEKLEKELDRLRRERGEQREAAIGTIDGREGLWARIGALNAIVREHPDMNAEVWALRFLFLLLDLLPLTAKLFRLAIQSPYEKRVAAARRRDTMPALAAESAAAVEEYRIKEQTRADKEVTRTMIMLDTDRRIQEVDMNVPSGVYGGVAPGPGEPPISGVTLGEYVQKMRSHESQPVPIPAELRRAGQVGTIALGALLVLATLITTLTARTVGGLWLVVVMFVAAAALAAYTHGFRRAPGWALRATFVTFLIGLFLPLVVLVINL